MIIGILKEMAPENRVVMTPENLKLFRMAGLNYIMENGAGVTAFYNDVDYSEIGVQLAFRNEVMAKADCLLTIKGFSTDEYKELSPGKILAGQFNILQNPEILEILKSLRLTVFSLDLLPRTTLAQSMDVLSSMATVSGYKAALDAASHLSRFFPMFMSASGTIRPARVLILGAGVAGLQALATSRKLGAVVEVFDVRSAVKEEVSSLGGKFIEVEGAREDVNAGGYAVEQKDDYLLRQAQLIHAHAVKSDAIICTAQIPGKKAPVLLHKNTVEQMRPGSVVIDLAAYTGGNCELTLRNENIEHKQIKIIGKVDYPSYLASDASQMFGNNMNSFLRQIIDESGNPKINFENEIVRNTCVTHEGEIVSERLKNLAKNR